MSRLPKGVFLKDVQAVFEHAVVELCRGARCHVRFSPADIDIIVRALVEELPGTLEELSEYLEREDWDGLHALAMQERTMRALRGKVMR